jgi:hypothetical protein
MTMSVDAPNNTSNIDIPVGENRYHVPPKPVGPAGPTYDRSVKIKDTGGAIEGRPAPAAPFRDPDPKSRMLGNEWEKASR